MSNILDRPEVLKLNRIHDPIRIETPKVVFGDLATYLANRRGDYILDAKGNKQRKMMAYDIEFAQNPDGTYDFDNCTKFQLVDWDTWVTLPIRPYDLFVNTAKSRIRIPRVVLNMYYKDQPEKKFRLNFDTVFNLYGGICAYSKRKLKRSEANMDHVIPRSKGGTTTWDNIVLCDKKINSKKGNRLNSQIGLPEVTPIIPESVLMANYLKNEKGIPEWNLFLKEDDN